MQKHFSELLLLLLLLLLLFIDRNLKNLIVFALKLLRNLTGTGTQN